MDYKEILNIFHKIEMNNKILHLKMLKYLDCYAIYHDELSNVYYFSIIDKNYYPKEIYDIEFNDIPEIILGILSTNKVNWDLIKTSF